jgi:hypothetical protein
MNCVLVERSTRSQHNSHVQCTVDLQRSPPFFRSGRVVFNPVYKVFHSHFLFQSSMLLNTSSGFLLIKVSTLTQPSSPWCTNCFEQSATLRGRMCYNVQSRFTCSWLDWNTHDWSFLRDWNVNQWRASDWCDVTAIVLVWCDSNRILDSLRIGSSIVKLIIFIIATIVSLDYVAWLIRLWVTLLANNVIGPATKLSLVSRHSFPFPESQCVRSKNVHCLLEGVAIDSATCAKARNSANNASRMQRKQRRCTTAKKRRNTWLRQQATACGCTHVTVRTELSLIQLCNVFDQNDL